ncbi:hypothetical protein F183_A24910 [Bryobacterales bacterium F-183]|nr:hypothetical protein F183_A24910 [Bryobacterales bacterium F-183]
MTKYFLFAVQVTLIAQTPAFHSKVAVFDVATRQSRVIYQQDGIVEAPNWSRDGKFLLVNKDGGLFRLTLDGKTQRIALDEKYRCNNDHDFSPDGRLIAFSASTPDVRQSRVFVSNADGSNVRLLTAESPSYFHGWSPDGKWLAFVGKRNDKFELFRVSVNGGAEQRLTAEGGYDDGPEYSRDGKWIYFNSNRGGKGWNIWRIPAEGGAGKAEQVTNDALEDWFPHFSPDGRSLLFLSFPAGTEGHNGRMRGMKLRMMPAAGGPIRELATFPGGQGTINVNSWSPDSKQFAYVMYESLTEALWEHRNLGKAFYENPATQVQAIGEFEKALALAPTSKREKLNYGLALLRGGKTKEGVAQLEKVQKESPELPHTWFNLGITYKKEGDFARAQQQFEQLVKIAPQEPVAHYNLGALYRQENRLPEAKAAFHKAIALNGNIAAPHFQLFNVHRALGETDDMKRELALFQSIKKANEGAAVGEDMEWCDYAEIWDPIDAAPEALAPASYSKFPLTQPATFAVRAGGDDVVVYSEKSAAVYRAGRLLNPLAGVSGIRHVAVGDPDNNGVMDYAVVTGKDVILYPAKKLLMAGDFSAALWLDYDHDYDLDLLLFGAEPKLLRNQGTAGFVDRTADFPFVGGHVQSVFLVRMQPDSKAYDVVASYEDGPAILYQDKLAGKYTKQALGKLPIILEVADVDRDSYLDLVTEDGVYRNKNAKTFEKISAKFARDVYVDGQTLFVRKPAVNWMRVSLTGVKNLKLSQGAEVEVKAGPHYQKQVYNGSPLLFDLGSHKQAEAVRISWANGLIQNETNQAAGKSYVYQEAQRLSGSCPMIWTWNGEEFEYITDVLGVAPLGAASGDGTYFPVDHDEFIWIPGKSLKANKDGQYEIRITEELSEVAYLDQLRLEAVDYPATQEVYTNEKWKAAPFPEDKLYATSKRVNPIWKSKPGFKRTIGGAAEMHTFEVRFAKPMRDPLLVLHGWVDWADGSTFRNAAQQSTQGLISPYLQVRDLKTGEWKTVVEDMGMPDGKPKVIALPVPGDVRELRIITNLCVYWTDVYLAEQEPNAQVRRTVVPASLADLRFRGFSKVIVHPERTEPEQFFYNDPMPRSSWDQTPGMYTRYGDVSELIGDIDDRFIVMGSGDEVRLVFDGSKLPPIPQGWQRDFLLKVDGWAKDRDANTAHSQTVEPLPFHGMSQYPFSTSEKFPDSVIHQDFLKRYQTRPALRLLRPLISRGR